MKNDRSIICVSKVMVLFGLRPYFEEHGKVKFSKLNAIFSVIYIAILIIISSVGLLIEAVDAPQFSKSRITCYLHSFYFLIAILVVLISYLYTFLKGKTLLELTKQSYLLDKNLDRLKQNIRKTIKPIWIFCFLILNYFVVDVIFFLFSYGEKDKYLKMSVQTVIYIILNMVTSTLSIQITTWVIVLKEKFIIINNYLMKNKDYKNIKSIVQIHTTLMKHLKMINSIYTVQILLFVVLNYINLIIYLYAMIYIIIFGEVINTVHDLSVWIMFECSNK